MNNFTISVETKGGLGNTLFQVATAFSVSLNNDAEFIVDSTSHYGAHYGMGKYTDNIFRKLNFSKEKLNYSIFSETTFSYTEIPKFTKNTKLSGYFQSEKYFEPHKEKVLDLFSVDNITKDLIKKNYYNILENDETVSIHVRRGDYLNLQNFHPVQSLDYYKSSYDLLGDDKLYIIFSDDIIWCKENFNFLNKKIFIENLDDFQSLYLMSLCNHNIIANSSFSWWGAWMNINKSQKVIAPKIWFGTLKNLETKDIYCKNWIII